MSDAIESATGARECKSSGQTSVSFTHVAIALNSENADSVIEATTDGGVRITTLQEFLDKSSRINGRPAVIAMRLRDTNCTGNAVIRARTFLGQPYDYSFLPDNRSMYCSELVWESFLSPDGSHIFTALPMNFRADDGSMPVFWTELFENLGEPVPQGVHGTNPNDLAKDRKLRQVHSYF